MDLELRDILQRSGLWESYRAKRTLHEQTDADELMNAAEPQAIEFLRQGLAMDDVSELKYEFAVIKGYGDWDDYAEDFGKEAEDEFLEWLDEQATERVGDAMTRLSYGITVDQGQIDIYREITAPEDWIQRGGLGAQPLGVYWSWDEDAAEAHWGAHGEGHITYLLAAGVDPRHVNWSNTIAANATRSTEDEKEITIIDNAPVTLWAVYAYDPSNRLVELPIGDFYGKQLPSGKL